MKIFGKRIHKGSLLLLLSFIALSVCCITIIGTVKTSRENELLSRKYYSDKARKFQIKNYDNMNLWGDLFKNIKRSNFALYTTVWDELLDIRGFYGKGVMKESIILEGRFFRNEDQFTGRHLAVVGKSVKQQLKIDEKDNSYTWEYKGVSYEVLGIIGTKQESRINHTVYLDLASGIQINTVNTNYIIDGKNSRDLSEILHTIEKAVFGNGQIDISITDEVVGMDKLFSRQKITTLLYILILLSFFLSSIIVTALWMSYKDNAIYIKRMLGYRNIEIISDICKEYLGLAGSGFLCSLLAILVIQYKHQALRITILDIFISFGVTVIFGLLTLGIPLYREIKAVISEKMR